MDGVPRLEQDTPNPCLAQRRDAGRHGWREQESVPQQTGAEGVFKLLTWRSEGMPGGMSWRESASASI